MATTTLRPDATIASSGPTAHGAGSLHAALSDDSDAGFVDQVTISPPSYADVSLDAISIPAGARIAQIKLRARLARTSAGLSYIDLSARKSTSADGQLAGQVVPVNWTAPTTITVATLRQGDTAGDLADVNIVRLSFATGSNLIRIYEIYVDVVYAAAPSVTPTAPTGIVTDTNRPLVEWSSTRDSDGGAITWHEAKVFTEAQYTAPGFDPDTSTPLETSGILAGEGTLLLGPSTPGMWTPDPLPNGTLRAYVKIGQTITTGAYEAARPVLWSDWDYTEFDLEANAEPDPPDLDVTAQHQQGRIRIDLAAAGAIAAHAFEIQRSVDDGDSWEQLRTVDGGGRATAAGGAATVYDAEVANRVPVIYRARAINIADFETYSDWTEAPVTAWSSRLFWLKSVLHPALNMAVEIYSLPTVRRPARQQVFQPLGASSPVVVSDTRAAEQGTVTFLLDHARHRLLDALLDLAEPLLLQGAPGQHWTDRHLVFGDLDRVRSVDKGTATFTLDTLPWTEVPAPTGDVLAWPTDDELGS